MFTIFINDLEISLTSNVKIFADDTKMSNTTANYLYLHEDFDLLMTWSHKWLIPCNADKGCVLHYGKHNDHIIYTIDNKSIHNKAI